MYVDRTLLHVHATAPHPSEQLPAAVYALGVGHEEMQKTELGGTERQLIALRGDAVTRRVEPQPFRREHLLGHERRRAPQHRVDARDQFARQLKQHVETRAVTM